MHNRTAAFCRTAKVFPRKPSGKDSFASKRRAELGRGRRRRIYINIRLRFCLRLGLRRWRFFYDCSGGFLLGWRIRHRSLLVLTTHKQCGSGKYENISFHDGRELDVND